MPDPRSSASVPPPNTPPASASPASSAGDERYRPLFALSPLPAWVYDLETLRFLEVNEAAVRAYGWSREEFLGMTIEGIRPPETIPLLHQAVAMLAGKTTNSSVHLHRTRAGSHRTVEIRSYPLVFDGRPARMVIVSDLTDWLAAQRTVRETEESFRAIFDRAPTGIVVASLDGRVVEVNPAYQAFVGYTAEELRGLPVSTYTPVADHPLEHEMLRRVAAGEVARVSFEKRYIRHGGAVVWGQLTLSCVLDAEGAPQRVVGMVEDITARKDAQASLVAERHFLRALVDNLSDGIIACDALGYITLYNGPVREAGLAVAGSIRDPEVAPAARVFGADGLVPLTPPEFPLARALRDEVVRDVEIVVVPPGAPARTLLANGRAIRGADGVQLGALLTLHDITERKAAEVALRAARDEAERARDRAEEASRAKSDFLARVSHELRTPLNSIIGFANVLRRSTQRTLSETERTYLDRVAANGAHLLTLINDLLDLTRIEAGRMTLEVGPVALDALVREMMEELEPQLRDRPLALSLVLPDGLRPLTTDAARLKQVLINLVANAIKFTERGEVRVVVEAGAGHEPRRIDICDTGIGIAADRMEAIFEAFEQAEPTTTRRFGGTGLGLAISRSLCELLGFRLEARSEPGVGTTMSVVLAP